MSILVFWLIVFVLIGAMGTALIFARRYQNPDKTSGSIIAIFTMFFMALWLIAGVECLK